MSDCAVGKRASKGRTLVLGQLVQLHEAGRDRERHIALALQVLELANGVRVRTWVGVHSRDSARADRVSPKKRKKYACETSVRAFLADGKRAPEEQRRFAAALLQDILAQRLHMPIKPLLHVEIDQRLRLDQIHGWAQRTRCAREMANRKFAFFEFWR